MLNLAALSIFFTLISSPAHAYVDPNTGGLLLQIITPIIGVIIFGWRIFIKKINQFWGLIFNKINKKEEKSR